MTLDNPATAPRTLTCRSKGPWRVDNPKAPLFQMCRKRKSFNPLAPPRSAALLFAKKVDATLQGLSAGVLQGTTTEGTGRPKNTYVIDTF
jgi:hypothetical protein